MAKGSTYTRGLCIVLNILLGIFGVILLLFGVAKSVKVEPVEDGAQSVNLSVGFGLATVLIAILGVYGAYREQVTALIVYSALMAIEFIVLLVLAVIVTLTQTQREVIERGLDKVLPLSQANATSKRQIEQLQLENQCCGLRELDDWEGQIPHSCFCSPGDLMNPDRCTYIQLNHSKKTQSNRNLHSATTPQDTMKHIQYVYSKTCGPILIEQRMNTLKILLGIFFTLATVTVAAVIVALLLCYKIHMRSAVTGISQDNDSRTKYELRPDKMP